jgi:hypothetical protein
MAPDNEQADGRASSAGQPIGRSAARVVAVAVGTLLSLCSLIVLGAGATALWADRTQRDHGYLTSGVHEFSAAGSALVTVPTELGSGGTGRLYSPGVLDRIRIQVDPAKARPVFVGIGPSADVDRYLADVQRTRIDDFWTEQVQSLTGGSPTSAPAGQEFWVASSVGSGPRTVTWDPSKGSWTVVVMNADGRPGIDVRAELGATVPALPWISGSALGVGSVFLAGGVLLITGAVRQARSTRPAA